MDPRLKWAFSQSIRQLIRLGAKFNKWKAETTIKIPELMQDLSKLTKIKWDDKVVNVVTSVIRIWKPFFKWISKQDQKIINNMEQKLLSANQALPQVKLEGKAYQSAKKEARESVQAQRNIKTESNAMEDNDMAKKRKKEKRNPLPQLPNRNAYGQKVDEYGFAIGKPGKKKPSDEIFDEKGLPLTYQQRQMIKTKKGLNDKKWYDNIPELLKSVTIPNFLQNLGSVDVGDVGFITGLDKVGITPIASFNLRLTLGDNNQGAVSTAIQRLFTNLRRSNTGATQYTIKDVEHYVYNLRAAIAIDRTLRRAYGCINKYDALNNKMPYAIFTAMGLDYDSFKDNKANIRLILNNNAVKLHTLMAGKCDLFERTAWLFDNLFSDGHTNKAQLYCMNPIDVPYYDYASSTWKSIVLPLTTNATTNTGRTWTQAQSLFDTLMTNIYANDKVSLISADIIKSYGLEQADCYFNVIPEDYTVSPVYSEEVLVQLQNATPMGILVGGITPNDTESYYVQSSALVSSLGAGQPIRDHFGKPYVNTYNNKIDVLDLAEHTRLLAYGNDLDTNNRLIITTYGTEILETIMFAVPFKTNNLGIVSAINPYGLSRLIYSPIDTVLYGGDATIAKASLFNSLWALFDWMPAFRPIAQGYYPSGQSTYSYTAAGNFIMMDLDNFYQANSGEVFANLNNVVIQSLLYWSDVIRDTKVVSIK